MTEQRTSDSLGSPDESRGGPDIDAAVANAESGSQIEGVHTPSGQENRVTRGWNRCARSTRRRTGPGKALVDQDGDDDTGKTG